MTEDLKQRARKLRGQLRKARRVVVKVGTNVVMHASGELAFARVGSCIEDIVALRRGGSEVILVSSGAVGLGAGRLGVTASLLPEKQACAAVGQVLLMALYEQAFARFGVPVAQVLLTEDDFTSRTRYLNLRNTFAALLGLGVLPIVNENDPVSTVEIEVMPRRGRAFGDNDKLSALVVSKIEADVLVILSNVDGVYKAPGPAKGGEMLGEVDGCGGELDALAGGPSAGGRGGMRTKLEAMRIATDSGGVGIIAGGMQAGTLARVMAGEDVGTIFLPTRRLSSRKRWIAFASGPRGRAVVTDGARAALETRGASLLFAGIVGVEGEFERGDVVAIVDENGREFARGMANHGAEAARRLIGKHSKAVAALTSEPNFDAFVTRDNLALTRG